MELLLNGMLAIYTDDFHLNLFPWRKKKKTTREAPAGEPWLAEVAVGV
jgi:hypothetical protein